jgi:hypothetical protein
LQMPADAVKGVGELEVGEEIADEGQNHGLGLSLQVSDQAESDGMVKRLREKSGGTDRTSLTSKGTVPGVGAILLAYSCLRFLGDNSLHANWD